MRMRFWILLSGLLVSLPALYAVAAPSKQVQSSDEKIKGYFAEGLQRQQEKRYPEAIMVYRRAIKLDANQPETLNNLGFCYKQMREYKKAVEYYKQALALKPDLAEAHEYLGEAYVQLGQLALAKQEYETLLKLDPKEAKELREKIEAKTSPSAS